MSSEQKTTPAERMAKAIERELRRWDGITSQADFQAAAPEMAKRAASAARLVLSAIRKEARDV